LSRDSHWQRPRLLAAMAYVVAEEGFSNTTVSRVCARANLPRRSFYIEFESREDCFLALMEEGLRSTVELISAAFGAAETWQEGIRQALAALLVFFESEPALARSLIVEFLAAGAEALEFRERGLLALTDSILRRWETSPRGAQPLPPMTVMSSVHGVIQRHLISNKDKPLLSLLGQLMGVVTAPYLRPHEVAAEVELADDYAQELQNGSRVIPFGLPSSAVEIPSTLLDPRSKRARSVLRYSGAHPGSSNRQVGSGVGISCRTQVSSLLSRLEGLGLLAKTSAAPGGANAWSLSSYGEEVTKAVRCRRGRSSTGYATGTRSITYLTS